MSAGGACGWRKDETYDAMALGGTRHEAHVEHASGTLDNPLSDAALERTSRDNAVPVLGGDATARVIETAWRFDRLADVCELSAPVHAPAAAGARGDLR